MIYGKTIWLQQFKDGHGIFSKGISYRFNCCVLRNESTWQRFIGLKRIGWGCWNGTAHHSGESNRYHRTWLLNRLIHPVRPMLFHLSNDGGGVVVAKLVLLPAPRYIGVKIETVFKSYNASHLRISNLLMAKNMHKFGDEQRTRKTGGLLPYWQYLSGYWVFEYMKLHL